MDQKQKHVLTNLAALVFSIFFFATAALALGGEQAGSPGISGQKPLNFLSVTLVDSGENMQNADDIPAGEPRFKLQFDKNVVNNTIWEINRKCFSLVSQDDRSIPLKVMKVDDTIDFTQRQFIFIQPAAPLSPSAAYTLRVSPDLKAKNGVSTLGGTTGGKGVSISFKTRRQAITQGKTQPAAQSVIQPNTGPAVQPAPSGGSDTGQTDSASGQIQDNAAGGSGAGNPGSVDKTNSTASTGKQDNNTPEAAAGQRQVAANDGGDSAGQASKPRQQGVATSPANAGTNLNHTNLLTILTVVLIIGWIAVEILMKRKGKGT